MFRENLVRTGKILKAHGIGGELLIRVDVPCEINSAEFLFPEINGLPVPFKLLKKEETGDPDLWIVSLSRVNSRDRALEIAGNDFFLEKRYLKPAQQNLTDISGFAFRDVHSGKEGVVRRYLDIPGNPLLEVSCEEKVQVVPIREELIVKFDTANREIILNLPEGIFEP